MALVLWDLRGWLKRDEALWALCRKYGLRGGVDWGAAPDPGIRGWFFAARYSKYIEGQISRVPVVAFDFTIGMGRNKRYGSGVGVKRLVPNADRIARGMKSKQIEGWTFVYSALHAFTLNRRLSADEFERMWTALLAMPAAEPAVAMRPMETRAGEVHIRPRRVGVGR